MTAYRPVYETSRALIVGINEYPKLSPLSYAVNDAQGIREVLIQDFGFLNLFSVDEHGVNACL